MSIENISESILPPGVLDKLVRRITFGKLGVETTSRRVLIQPHRITGIMEMIDFSDNYVLTRKFVRRK